MTNKTPLVSIIIPVYNGANFMREAIDSALAQTYPNIEVIVINDGSTDNGKTDRIAKSYGNKIRYFEKKNGGVSSALNLGIKKMKGTYFSWLSHDDVYLPEKVEEEIKYLTKNHYLNKKIIPFSDYALINAGGKLITEVKCKPSVLQKKPEFALLRGLINGNTLLIPKKAFDSFGGFDEKLRCTQDYQKWLDFTRTYQFRHVPKVLVKSRYHKKQVSNTSPLVQIEGDPLWLSIIESVDDKTKIRLDGNIYAYYSHLADYLRYSPYEKAYLYCINKLKSLPKDVVPKDEYRIFTEAPLSKHKIIKFYQFMQREGAKNVFIRICKKLKLK